MGCWAIVSSLYEGLRRGKTKTSPEQVLAWGFDVINNGAIAPPPSPEHD